MPKRLRLPTLALGLAIAAALAGCAGLVPTRSTDGAGTIVVAPIEIDADLPLAHWYLPAGEATALVVLQHGFTRRCGHLRGTSHALMAAGLMALCIDAPMAGGNPALAEALAHRLAAGLVAPDGRTAPPRIIVAGHSAGAVFAAALGASLDAVVPERLAGALLFDPVATSGFEGWLRTISAGGRRPVLALLAPPHRCNAQANALPILQRLRREALDAGANGVVGMQLGAGATHADVEGEDTDRLAEWACGRVSPAHTARLREFAVAWARDLAAGRRPALPDHDAATPID